ncbi:response regulator [Sulfitobacter sp. JB4-11]|uniref:response regulator n=1 Tax=Sulfitobacter rhodophyticola TaxID=3238304 RepID=UPI003D819B2A
MRILAVDDDPVILDILEECLPNEGQHELVCCGSAEEALAITQTEERPFDCLLLDIMLPGVDGITLCDQYRQSAAYRTTPIIMITASTASELMEAAFRAGATDFLCKPLDLIELRARINAAGMLNASLHREQEARSTLEALSEKLHLRFDEEIALDVSGVGDALALENALLRMPEGCYAMSLFSLDIVGLRGIHRAVPAPAFRHHIEAVAEAAVEGLEGRAWRLAYVGSGRFVGLVMGRMRLNTGDVLSQINASLALSWDEAASGTPQPPVLRLNTITDQRLWSGLSASDALRAHLENNDTLSELASEDSENALFDRLEMAIEGDH